MKQMADFNVLTQHISDTSLPALKSFGVMKRQYSISWPLVSDKISIPDGLFRLLLRLALENIAFDEHYYLFSYPDVVEALKDGLFTSARHHYLEFGFFEDRLPHRVEVDDAFYLWANPDIKAEVEAGNIPSAQEHFEQLGYKEGREPREGWSILAS